MTTLLWLRDDLRTADHEALTAAACAQAEGGVVALWVREEVGPRPLGAATRWWYHRSLAELGPRLADLGVPLVFARGDARAIVPSLASDLGARSVHWSRRYAPDARAVDAAVKQALKDAGIGAHSHEGALLVDPWTFATDRKHYQVFTPFHRAAADVEVPAPLPEPGAVPAPGPDVTATLQAWAATGALMGLEDLGLLDRHPEWWRATVAQHWEPGEVAARERLQEIEAFVTGYRTTRNLPADPDATSRLSPRLRSGELSPRTVLHAAQQADLPGDDRQAWIRQLYWREFCWHLTYHVPGLATTPLRPEFADFPYAPDADLAQAWQRGRTGFALVDAGMQQLWQTGWMHNRVRMVTASLVTKNLLQPWWEGEQWFWDTLVDADEANNPVSWQWVAGCGADAAPYFRVFNPELQREKFDPDGRYVRRWCPDAAAEPIVDLKASRQAALDAYAQAKQARAASDVTG